MNISTKNLLKYTYTAVYFYAYILTYKHIHIHIYILIHIYTYTYINTHTYITRLFICLSEGTSQRTSSIGWWIGRFWWLEVGDGQVVFLIYIYDIITYL